MTAETADNITNNTMINWFKEAEKNILQVIIGIILVVVAILLIILATIPAFIWLLIFSVKRNEDKKARDVLGNTATFFYNIAASFDQTGGVAFGGFFTWWFLTKDTPYKFGNFFDTISLVLGINQITGTLTKSGKLLVNILDKFEAGHCLIAYLAGVEEARKRILMYNQLTEK